jgi:hypothetical protein
MPIEPERMCGYRQVGGLYFVCPPTFYSCDRLPLIIPKCPCCGEHPRFTRGVARIDPQRVFDEHKFSGPFGCNCPTTCTVCYPERKAYLMWVGKDYTYESLVTEAKTLGISKRIPRLPRDYKKGDEIFLAMKSFIVDKNDKRFKHDAVVMSFTPNLVEYLMEKKKTYTKKEKAKVRELYDQGITIVYVDRTPENAVHFKRSKERKQKSSAKIKPLEEILNEEE